MTAFRSGFVALAGLPNAGKSTLLNRLLGTRLSIVSPKPQTTREKLLGILDRSDFQIVFVDAPGWLEPKYGLQRAMAAHAKSAILEDADAVVLLVDPRDAGAALDGLLSAVAKSGAPAYLAMNKVDAVSAQELERARERCAQAVPFVSTHKISAKDGRGVDELLKAVAARLPEQPPYYPPGQLTDRYERFFVAECVREAIFDSYGEELPYSCAVEVDRFVENQGREPDLVRLTIYVERETQKGIVIGKKGQKLREVTQKAERAAEKMLGRPLRLELWVKVLPHWRDDRAALRRFGY